MGQVPKNDEVGAIENPGISELVAWRRQLHKIPEFGFELTETAAFVAAKLRSFGIKVTENVGGGVVGVLQGGRGSRKIGLRADMDALEIHELNTFGHASRRPGMMHACGHDGHTAMLLGAARSLAACRDFDATVTFVFQPAEEHGRGARAMVEAGLFGRFDIDEIYSLHNLPGLAIGTFGTRAGPIMAAEDNFLIELAGTGGHAAMPHRTREVLVAACQIVVAAQTIVARQIDPLDEAVVSVTELVSNGARNVLPGHCHIKGDVRSYTTDVQALIENRLRTLASGIAAGFEIDARTDWSNEFVATVNTPHQAQAACSAALRSGLTVIADHPPLMASDDFGFMLQQRPGNYAFLGNGVENGPGGVPLHNPRYDFNDEALPFGVGYFVSLVRTGCS